MMEQWQYTLANWVIFTGLGYGAYRYYTQNQKKKNQPTLNRATPAQDRELQDIKQGRGRRRDGQFDLGGSEKEKAAVEQSKKRRTERQKPAANRFEGLQVEGADLKSESDDNDKEWASQLDNLRKGTNLAAPQRKETRVKTVKQSSANRTPELSATSSTTGGDADDDLSPANSPALGATNGTNPVQHAANVVADMLEPVAAAPSILRVAPGEVKPKPNAEQGWEVAGGKKVQPKKQEDAAKADTTETKKQRQNKRKVEEQKAQREQDEQARRGLMEQQRRTAREARGESAKNGLAPPPASSSWTARKAESTSVPPNINSTNAPLLDTYNDGASTASSSNAPKHDASSPLSNTTSHSFWDHLPSEEEQMRRLAEEDESSWNTVTDKKKERKKKAKDVQVNGDLTDASTDGKRPDSPITNGNSKPFNFAQYRQQDDSDWAVA